MARALRDPALTLAALAQHRPTEATFRTVVDAARTAPTRAGWRAVFPELPAPLRAALIREAFPLTGMRRWEWDQLPDEVLASSYDAVPPDVRIRLRPGMAPLLGPDLVARGWAEAVRSSSGPAMAPLAPRLHDHHAIEEAWVAARGSATLLATLAGHRPPRRRPEAYWEAIEAARGKPGYALPELMPLLPDDVRSATAPEALAAALSIRRPNWRAFVLARLAAHLPAALRPEVLTAILTVDVEKWRAEALCHIAGHLPLDLLGRAADDASAMAEPYWQALATAGIAPFLPADRRRTAVAGLAALSGKPGAGLGGT